ncbi:transcription factor Opi1-domain-containing protein [Mycena floridula]|nr:transcription factor Opi1-domain-containing protein [Mycena floridula]
MDEDVLIAVQALGDMRRSQHAGPSDEGSRPTNEGAGLLDRAYHLYDRSKASSRVMKYGAGLVESAGSRVLESPMVRYAGERVMESGVMRYAAGSPVMKYAAEYVPQGVSSQFDRYRYAPPGSPGESASPQAFSPASYATSPAQSDPEEDEVVSNKRRKVEQPETGGNGHKRQRSAGKGTHSRHSSRGSVRATASPPPPLPDNANQRSMVSRATSSLTGLVLMSDESMRRLRFVLGWLMYATQHIDKQVTLLRDFTASLGERVGPSAPQGQESEAVSQAEMARLQTLRSEIVGTVRHVVEIVSKYTGGGTPNASEEAPSSSEGLDAPARALVKGFILRLPGRWKAAMSSTPPVALSSTSANSSGARSSNPSPTSPSAGTSTRETALHTAHRILLLATESLDMVRGVTGVVKGSLERAEGWAGKERSQQSDWEMERRGRPTEGPGRLAGEGHEGG